MWTEKTAKLVSQLKMVGEINGMSATFNGDGARALGQLIEAFATAADRYDWQDHELQEIIAIIEGKSG